jgi:hypothetical protein
MPFPLGFQDIPTHDEDAKSSVFMGILGDVICMNLCTTGKTFSDCLFWISAPQTIKCKLLSCCTIAVASAHIHSQE